MSKIIFPGLALYCLLSGAGLFLRPELSGQVLLPWVWSAGYLFLVFLISYVSLFSKKQFLSFEYTILGVIGLNFAVQISGGAASPLYPAYFLLCAAATFLQRPRAYYLLALVLCIEGANLFSRGHPGLARVLSYAGFAASLSGVVLVIAPFMNRILNHAQIARERYRKLLADANAVDLLAPAMPTEALSEQNRQAANVSVAVEREGAFKGLMHMISEMVPAHTYALFLTERDDDVFTLRAIQSDSRCAAPIGSVRIIKGCGLIGISIDNDRPHYISDKQIPSNNLGYYTHGVCVQSLFIVPIAQRERTVGVLVVDSLEYDAFSFDNQDLLVRFAPFFSQIIEKIRISQELDLRAKNFAALHDMSSILSSSLDICQVLDKLTIQVKTAVSYDYCAFLLYEERTGDAVLTALQGYEPKPASSRFPLKDSAILQHLLNEWQNRNVVTIHYDPDLGDRGRDISLFPLKEMRKPIKSLFSRSLVAGGKCIGAAIFAAVRPNAFTEYQRNFLDTLLNQVSMVMDNSMLHTSIKNMARTDGLTGLLNHRTFMEKLSDEYKRLDRDPRPFSVLLVDIDFFKKVNDTYGHPIGDVALSQVAGILKEAARGSDFVARYGGEEFIVGMVDAEERGAHQMAERVRKTVEKTPIVAGPTKFSIQLSIGIASFPSDTKRPEDLVGLADEALYYAKRTGRNKVCCHKDVTELEPAPLKQ